jgi:hypothetical protein
MKIFAFWYIDLYDTNAPYIYFWQYSKFNCNGVPGTHKEPICYQNQNFAVWMSALGCLLLVGMIIQMFSIFVLYWIIYKFYFRFAVSIISIP